jgi:hypothetical protein
MVLGKSEAQVFDIRKFRQVENRLGLHGFIL